MPVRPNYYKHNNKKYFRNAAENVLLGSFGEKKSPVGGRNYLSVEGQVPSHILDNYARKVTTVKENWQAATQVDLGSSSVAGFDVAGSSLSASRQTSFSLSDLRSADVELVKFVLDEGDVKRVLNQNYTRARTAMSNEGNDARIATSVWIAMSATLARDFSVGAELEMSASADGIKITSYVEADGKAKGSLMIARRVKNVITLSQGTTFAYGMHKVKTWEQSRRRGRVMDLEDDYQGMG
ncbi:hypothetical protein K0651_07845 [Ornithinimicrobium sp. Arc0846-15]|nr:hypothetical protein [Ornithinimicrobium laminariae]